MTTTRRIRTHLGQLVWIVAVGCALVLAVGALLIALDANPDNALVKLVLDVADALDLEVFSRGNGIFTFDGADAPPRTPWPTGAWLPSPTWWSAGSSSGSSDPDSGAVTQATSSVFRRE